MKNILNTLKTNSKKGFTLVEMIIVIVIIAILAAIAIPAMKGYIEDANEATAVANCRTALTASEATAPMMTEETYTSFDEEVEALLGSSCVLGEPTGSAGVYTTTGDFADGTLNITFTAGQGTDSITWTSEGITAEWKAGDSAPVIVE